MTCPTSSRTQAILFLLAILYLSAAARGPVFGQEEKKDEPIGFPLPKIEVPETDFEWEKVLQGAVITYSFPVKNVGNAPLKILRVQSNCGCTTPSFTKEIAPGAEGHVELRVNTGEVSAGFLRKNATIHSNDPTQGQLILWMRGQVDPILTTEGPVLKISGMLSEVKEATFRFTPGTSRRTAVISARSEKDLVEIVSVTPIEGGGADIVVRAPPHEKPELLRDNLFVRVQLDDEEPVDTSYPVAIEHLDTVKISPGGNVVFYRRQTAHLERDPERDVSKEITVRAARADLPVQVVGARLEGAPEGLFSVEVRAVVPGQHYVIKIRVLRTENESQVQARLVIETDDPKRPTREREIFAQFRMRPPG